MIDWLVSGFASIHGWLFETALQPLLFQFGFMGYADDAFDALELTLLGLIEILVLFVLFRPLESWRPAEHWTHRRDVRVDVLYTVLHRIGVVPLVMFVLLTPVVDGLNAWLRLHDIIPPNLEDLIPPLATAPLLAFFAYVLILDLAEYLRHRLQHRLHWWWALHSLHHSQQQLSFWADDRNHLLDDALASLWFAAVALLIGVPTEQFVLIVILMRMVESLSHANVRLSFGPVLGRLIVSPRFHRRHHGIGVGHEGRAHGCNFAPLFPFWDILFGTANFADEYPRTGIRDQDSGVDYGRGFVRQQILGFRRLWNAVVRPRPTP